MDVVADIAVSFGHARSTTAVGPCVTGESGHIAAQSLGVPAHDAEQQTASRTGGVDVLVQADEGHATRSSPRWR